MRVISTAEFEAAARDSGLSFQFVADERDWLDLVTDERPRRRRRPRGER